MYTVRKANENDITTIFNFTNNLVQYHEDMSHYFIISEESMLSEFKNNAFECLLLFEKVDCKEEPVGYLLYMNEYSFLHGYGYFIDDFYISSHLRGKGLGKRLMYHLYKIAINNNINFVKLSFQISIIGLEKLYTALGFVNITTPESGVSIYELFGESKIQEFFHNGAVGYDDLKENYNVNDVFFIIKRQEKGIS